MRHHEMKATKLVVIRRASHLQNCASCWLWLHLWMQWSKASIKYNSIDCTDSLKVAMVRIVSDCKSFNAAFSHVHPNLKIKSAQPFWIQQGPVGAASCEWHSHTKNPHLTKCNYSIPCPGTYTETQLSQKLAQCNFQALTLEQQMDGEVLLLPIYQSWHNQDHVHQHSSPCDEHGEKQNKTKQERMNHQDRAKKMVTILHNMPQTLMFSLYMSEKSPCF